MKIFLKALTCISCFTLLFADETGYDDFHSSSNGEEVFATKQLSNTKKPVVFDVGANVGNYTNMIVSFSPEAIIYAFEPNPATFSIFTEHAKLHPEKFKNTIISNIGMSDGTKDSALMYCYDGINQDSDMSQLNTLVERKKLNEFTKETFNAEPFLQEVELSSVDQFCEEHSIECIDLLKIDTEGFEFSVIQGSKKMLSKQKIKAIQFEYGGTYKDCAITLEEVYNFLKDYDYNIYRLTPTGKIAIPTWSEELECYRYCNYIALID